MKSIVWLFLVMCIGLSAGAQKLPQVQQTSLRAPANVKIDGKTNDWGDKFEASNTKAELLYTIANDDKKLYLIAQADNADVMNRIVNGGIKLIIQTNGTESDKDAPYIKFPFLQKGQHSQISVSYQQFIRTGVSKAVAAPQPYSKAEEVKNLDSLAKINNKRIREKSKLIYTSGLAGIETLLPIYNQNGIEAVLAFDNQNACTWEIAIDLKIFDLSLNKTPKFKYRVVINDEPNKFSTPNISNYTITTPDGTLLKDEMAMVQLKAAIRSATIGFWGEYTLAK